MIQILNTIVPVLLMLSIGVTARRTGLLSREGINALKSVVVNITLPAVMLNAFATMTYTVNNIRGQIYSAYLMCIHRIFHIQIPLFDPVNEPFGIKVRYISSSTNAKYHYPLTFSNLNIRYLSRLLENVGLYPVNRSTSGNIAGGYSGYLT